MIFNGLSGSDLIIYNALVDLLEPGQAKQVSSGQLAARCNCHPNTVQAALKRVADELGLVKRRMVAPGVPYEYTLPEDR